MSILGACGNTVLIAARVDAAPRSRLPAPAGRLDAVPPQAYFVGSAVFHYLGPSFAVLLFARVDVLGVAWLRIASAAAVFAILRRPWHKFLAADRSGKALIVALGAVFAGMNACFYIKIHLRSIDELSTVLDRFLVHGDTTTSLINASPIPRRDPPLDSDD